jgi:hypothetical protein
MHQQHTNNQITPALSYVYPQYINIMNCEDLLPHSQKLPLAPSNCNPVQFNASSAPSHNRAPRLKRPKFDGMKKYLDQLRTCLNAVYTEHRVRPHQHRMHLLCTSRDKCLQPTHTPKIEQFRMKLPEDGADD